MGGGSALEHDSGTKQKMSSERANGQTSGQTNERTNANANTNASVWGLPRGPTRIAACGMDGRKEDWCRLERARKGERRGESKSGLWRLDGEDGEEGWGCGGEVARW